MTQYKATQEYKEKSNIIPYPEKASSWPGDKPYAKLDVTHKAEASKGGKRYR